MEYSFYGGRPGKSFVIAKAFDSYKTMEENFAQGLNYQEVVYGEYVLINTSDPRNIENGKLYKRGYEGPEYIGTIEGPPGYSPHVQVKHFNEVNNPENTSDKNKSYLFSQGSMIVGSTDDGDEIKVKDLVPGNLFDTIKWKTLSCRMVTSFFYDENNIEILKIPANNVKGHRRYVSLKQAESVPDDSEAEIQNMISVKEFFYDEEGFYTEVSETETINGIQFIRKAVDGLENGAAASILKTSVDNVEKKLPSAIYIENGGKLKEIKYSYEEQAEETVADIAFQFPYYVFDWDANSISPYENREDEKDKSGIKEVFEQPVAYGDLIFDNDSEHPFYSDMKLKVPHGIKGDSLKGLKVIPASEYQKLKVKNSKYYEAVEGITNHSQWETTYTGLDDDLPNETTDNPEKKDRQILVYEYYDYRNNSNGAKITKYLGDYNMIESIDINAKGTVTIKYTHNNTHVESELIRWIEDIGLDQTTGVLDVRFNTGLREGEGLDSSGNGFYLKDEKAHYRVYLKWPNDIKLADDGVINCKYTKGYSASDVSDNLGTLTWITGIDLNPANGLFTVYFNNSKPTNVQNTTFTKYLSWVKDVNFQDGILKFFNTNENLNKTFLVEYVTDINIEQGNGDVEFTYSTKDENGEFKKEIDKNVLKYIKKMEIGQNSPDIKMTYSTHDENGNYDTETLKNILKYVKGIQISQDGIVTLTWTTKKTDGTDDTTTLENKLKWAEDVFIADNGNLTIKYNTKSAGGSNDTKIEEGKVKWIKSVRVNDNFQLQVQYNNDENYFNLGSIKTDSTLSIAFNISKDVAGATVEDNLRYLRNKYPNGLTVDATGNTVDSAWMKGKIITVGSTSDLEVDNNKLFYAFDYSLNSDNSYKGWYCLGSIGEASPDEVYGMAFTESEANTKLNELRPGAVCFLVTEVPE